MTSLIVCGKSWNRLRRSLYCEESDDTTSIELHGRARPAGGEIRPVSPVFDSWATVWEHRLYGRRVVSEEGLMMLGRVVAVSLGAAVCGVTSREES